MINSQYKSVITSAGHTANTQLIASGTTIVFDEIAFGSGGLVPNENATGLIKEEVRIKIHSVAQNQTDTNILEIEAVIPAHIGGFTINEAALYLDDGTLYAVASLPESYKPILDQGAGKEFSFVFFLTSVGVENVALSIDGGASFVTTNYFQNELKKYAFVTGDETKKFKVADAQNKNEAVNKKQIDELELRLNDSIETINVSIGTLNGSIETIKDSVSKNTTTAITVTTATKVVGAGYMGEFGQGLWNTFYQNGTFTIPNDVTKIRVRVVGGGGSGAAGGGNGATRGGSGGGYAHGVFDVVAGTTYAVTVGTGGTGAAGGTSSFGTLISATGGGANGANGGIGIGGDFQAQGGKANSAGGGGAGSQLGNGGNSYAYGGAGIANGHSFGYGGGSAFASSASDSNNGAENIGGIPITPTLNDLKMKDNPIGATIRFPFDCFTGGGGSSNTGTNNGIYYGGTGAGGGGAGGTGGNNGGVGGGGAAGGVGGGGAGGIGGGGSGGTSGGGAGGAGLVIVEW